MDLQTMLVILSVTIRVHHLNNFWEYWIITDSCAKPLKIHPPGFGTELLLSVLWVPFFNSVSQDCQWKCQDIMQSSIQIFATTFMADIIQHPQHKLGLLLEKSSTFVNTERGCKDICSTISVLSSDWKIKSYFIRKLLECLHSRFPRKNNIGFPETRFLIIIAFVLILIACVNVQPCHSVWQHTR